MKTYSTSHFLSRELSWLAFNQRVLDEALNPANPLLERVKFFTITSSNLDEFFEVRVAGLKQQVESDIVERSVDGKTASETLRAIRKKVRQMIEQQYRCWREELLPALSKNGIHILDYEHLSDSDRNWVEQYYRANVRPVLTPLGIDPSHPFPQLLNKSLNIVVQVEIEREGEIERRLAVVQVPRVLPRLVRLPREDERLDFIYLGHLIGHYLADLFPGTKILGFWHFRVTRNSELYIDEEDIGNLLKAVENELHNRRRGAAVRLEADAGCPAEIYQYLLETLELTEEDLYLIDGPLNPTRLMVIYAGDHSPELRDKPFVGPTAPAFRGVQDIFSVIRQRDVLVHHPYESFGSVVDFLEQAAQDPNVLAIKQTLYRTGGDPRIVGALMDAVKNGKQVTAVTELKARFDEANNILWARRLEEAGVHVVYGIVHHKVHSKIALVVRRDEDGLRRYVHLGTGNYNPSTARLYTDLSFFTAQPDYGEDATNFFNLLTGISHFQGAKKFLISPFTTHEAIMTLVKKETEHAHAKKPGRIIAKMNSLVDQEIIEALYAASQAGVKIDLIIRGICCLRPGVAGLSENIAVRSIIGRFLEHSRIFYFENAGSPKLLLGSADWMPRNFFRRIEIVFPIEEPALRDRIVNQILATQLADNVKASILDSEGNYSRPAVKKENQRASQAEFMALALGEAKTRRGTRAVKKNYNKIEIAKGPR
ncbi:MAG: polyphosphate kinase 1 [Chthoniobacter sp.]|uniref:polyphosphate kinase 1 n=1 Tax=Chthoniobacter sp. TaxID=2510640 RepID=UPI0032A885C6